MKSTNERDTLRSRIELTRQAVRDEAEYLRGDVFEIIDGLHEIADQCVPIYCADLADVLASDTSLGFGPDGIPVDPGEGVWKVLQAAIYERLYEAAIQEATELGLLGQPQRELIG